MWHFVVISTTLQPLQIRTKLVKVRKQNFAVLENHSYTQVGKIFNFRPKSPFIEPVQDRPMVLWISYGKSQVANRFVSVPVTLSDLKWWDTKGQIFLADLPNQAQRSYSLTQSEQIWHHNTRGEKRVSNGSAMPTTLGNVELSIPKIFGTSYMHVHSVRNSNHILMAIKLDVKNFFRVDCTWTNFFW